MKTAKAIFSGINDYVSISNIDDFYKNIDLFDNIEEAETKEWLLIHFHSMIKLYFSQFNPINGTDETVNDARKKLKYKEKGKMKAWKEKMKRSVDNDNWLEKFEEAPDIFEARSSKRHIEEFLQQIVEDYLPEKSYQRKIKALKDSI